MSRQLKSLNSAYKSLYSAVESCQNEEASNLMKEFAPLITKVKPGDTSIDSPTATRLIDMFEAKLEPLYRLFPANTTCFVIAYFFSLLPQLKLVKLVWQEIACSGLIVGLDTYGLASEEGCAEFHKEFVTGLCKLLSDKDASKLTLDLRYAIGMLLANLVGEQPEAKKVILDPDVLGVAGLARLFVGSTGFRTTDAYLQIIARLAPPKKDANRRSYFSSVLCTSACKAMFGTSRARKFVDLINRSGTKAWFERSDLLHAEIGFNNKRSQRYIAQAVFVNGDTYSNKSAALRVYVDLELVIMIFQSPGNEQLMTTSLDNICAIRVEPQADDMSTVTIELKSPLIMQIRNEVASQKSSMSLDFQFSNHEADRFQKVIDSKGLDKKVVKPPKALKQSLSQHATQLGPIAPITPTSLETKTHIIEGYYHSDSKSSRPNLVDPVTVRSSRSAVSSSESSPTCAGGCSKPRSKSDSDSGLSSIDDDASQIRPAIGVRPKRKTRAVILDSDEEQVTMPRKAASPKRKIAELDDNEISISPPGAKRARTSPKIDHDHSQSQNTSSLPAFVLVKEGPFPPSSSSPLLKGPDPHKVDQTGSLDSEGSLNTPKGSSSRHAKSKSSHSLDRVDNELHNGTRQFDYIQRASLGASGVSGELAPPHAQKNLAKQEGAIRGLNYFSEEALQSLRSSRPHLESGVEATTISIDQNRGTRHVNTAKGSAIGHYLDSPDPPSSPIRPAMVLKQKARSALVLKKSPPKTVRKDAPKSSLLRRENQFIFPAHPTGSGTGPERGSMSPVNRPKSVKHMRASIVSTVVNTASPVTKSIHGEEILHRSHVPDVSSRDKTAEIDEEPIKIPNEPDRGKEKPSAKRFVRWESTHYPKFEEAMSILKLKKSKTGHNSISEHQMRNAPSLVSANASDSDSLSEDEVPRVPISGIDAIAEVLTAIQQVIMENVGKKVSEVRTEARIARARMVEVAVGDLGAMHESLEGLLGQFFGLDEHYEAVDQAVRAGREQLQGANETVKDILLNIIREHDRITKDDAVFQMPIRQPPKCII